MQTRGADAGSTTHWTGSFDDATRAADVRLTLPARPESVGLARQVLFALAKGLGLPDHVCDDLRLAVTEACTNVVRHAYDDFTGQERINVLARPEGDALQVIVSDSGSGIGPSRDTAGPGFGLGLISALTDHLEIEHAPGEGSRLAMWFTHDRPISETA